MVVRRVAGGPVCTHASTGCHSLSICSRRSATALELTCRSDWPDGFAGALLYQCSNWLCLSDESRWSTRWHPPSADGRHRSLHRDSGISFPCLWVLHNSVGVRSSLSPRCSRQPTRDKCARSRPRPAGMLASLHLRRGHRPLGCRGAAGDHGLEVTADYTCQIPVF